jgi:hypothetical protein
LGARRETVPPHERWLAARTVCPGAGLCDIDRRGAWGSLRQPAGLPCARVQVRRSGGRRALHREAGPGSGVSGWRWTSPRERARGVDRRIPLALRQAAAKRVARCSRKRWPLETACQPRAAYVHAASTTWAYPQATWGGLGLAVVASNLVAVGLAAWRRVPGAAPIAPALSLSAVATASAQTYQGLRMASPEDAWRVCSRMRPAERVATLRALAQQVCLTTSRTSSRGPKKPRPKRERSPKASHVSTAKIRRNLTVNAATP